MIKPFLLLVAVLANSICLASEHKSKEQASDAWMSSIQEQIQEKEYFISKNKKGIQAPNRSHNLRTYFSKKGIEVYSRTSKDSDVFLKMSYSGLYREGNEKKSFSKKPANGVTYKNNKVTIKHNQGVDEWYINSRKGLEHGFNLNKRLKDKGVLNLTIDILQAEVIQNGKDLSIRLKDGRQLDYKKLLIVDANKQLLPANLVRLSKHQFQIQLDDANAQYPIIIDPILTSTADTQMESNQAGAFFGIGLGAAGDVNGDGYADVIVGARHFDGGTTDSGAAFIYHGSASGIVLPFAVQLNGNQTGVLFGNATTTAGDVNGDGYSDVVVSSPFQVNAGADEGAVFIYYGSSSGITSNNVSELMVNQGVPQFGISASGAGDVNGDGYADVVVGATKQDAMSVVNGTVFVFHGSSNGIENNFASKIVTSQSNAAFGIRVSSAGDVNADGYADIIVGARDYDNGNGAEGAAFVYHGSTGGVSTTVSTILNSNQVGSLFGESVSTAGDVNGDGYGDVIVGAIQFTNGQSKEGAAFVYHGSAGGIQPTAVLQFESNQQDADFGRRVDYAGDINGDGYGDVIVGSSFFTNGQNREGAAFIYLGSATGLLPTIHQQLEINQANASFGARVAGAGDVNGDGYADVIVGAFRYSNGDLEEGGAFVYHGGASGIVDSISTQLEVDQTCTTDICPNLGLSVDGAGDVNGDGFADVIVGARGFDNGEVDEGAAFIYYGSSSGLDTFSMTMLESNQTGSTFGEFVSRAGDVNGDGFDDVIVGASLYDNGELDEGAAFIYHGGINGVSSSYSQLLESNQAGARFGSRVSSAGDVNGDGFADVIVGALQFDNGSVGKIGAAFVYHGSANGISSVFSSHLESNQVDSMYGTVSDAGDVNGDGYGDVIVGARWYDDGEIDEGAAFIYLGSANGINPIFSTHLQLNQVYNWFGESVSTAGDVNGDGYDDIIVGALATNFGNNTTGSAYIYHGSSAGIDNNFAIKLSSDQAGSQFGRSVSSAGDVNGDGFDDVLVGSPDYNTTFMNEGAVFTYYGSTAGISDNNNNPLVSNQADASFGYGTADVGDVNGDGFADVIVGSFRYDNGETDEGAAFLYLGNGSGRLQMLQQKNTDNSLISKGQLSASSDQYKVSMIANSSSGRELVKLEIETCEFDVGFTDITCITTVGANWQDAGMTGSVNLDELITGLTSNTAYHWRARVLHKPLTTTVIKPVFGPWFRFGGSNNTIDFKTRKTDFMFFDGFELNP